MKTNITIDNYEAYLLDYMEGSLSPEGAEELRQFVAAQGLDWDELTAPLPYLEAPQMAYDEKDKLKKKGAVVPLYVKIASAAAAAGLLLTVSLWPEKQLPKVEPIAELKPILPGRLITENETNLLSKKTVHFVQLQVVRKEKTAVSETIPERVETPLLAQLEPRQATTLTPKANLDEPDFEFLAYRLNSDLAFAQANGNLFAEEAEEEPISLIGRGLLWLTKGRHSTFASLIGSGVSEAKKGLAEAATDMALAAYQRADEQWTETKERWEEKRGE